MLDALLGAVIVVSCVAAVLASSSSASAVSPTSTGTVTRGTVQATESTPGTVLPAAMYPLGFPAGGTISAIDVSVGQQVVQGQVLAAIEATAAQSALTVAQDNLIAAQDRLAQEEQSGTTPAQGPAGSSSAKPPTSTLPNQATVAAEEAVVVADEQAVSTAQQDLSGTTLVAPINGTITAINAKIGQTVGSQGNSASAKASGAAAAATGSLASAGSSKSSAAGGSSAGDVMTLADLSQLDVTCDVAQANIGTILQGQPATVTMNALPGHEFAATVASVAQIGTMTGGVVTFPVTLALEHPTSAVRPGMSATVTIVTSSVNDVLAVPSSAVHGTGKMGTVTVRSAAGVDSRVTVVTGLVGTSITAVYGDLTVGETVILPSVSISPPVTGAITRKAARTLGGSLGGVGRHAGHFGGGGKLGLG